MNIAPLDGDRSETIKRLCEARKAQVHADEPETDIKELPAQTDIEEGRRRTMHPLFHRELQPE